MCRAKPGRGAASKVASNAASLFPDLVALLCSRQGCIRCGRSYCGEASEDARKIKVVDVVLPQERASDDQRAEAVFALQKGAVEHSLTQGGAARGHRYRINQFRHTR